MQIEYSKPFSARQTNRRGAQGVLTLALLLASHFEGKPASAQAASAQAASPQAARILKQMMNAERNANYTAVQTMARRNSAPVRVRIWRLGRKRRLEYLAPDLNRGDILVDDGQNTWLYHRAENTAVQTRSQAPRDGSNASRRVARVRLSGQESVGGRAAWKIDLVRPNGKGIARRVWIDKASGLRLSAQVFDAQGQAAERVTLSDLKTSGVDASRFRWTPPGGAQVVRTNGQLFSQFAPAKAAASWLQSPRFIPSGYMFESAVVDNAKGEAWLRYASSTRRISLFQQRAADATSTGAAPQKVGGGWYRAANGSRVLIVGAPDGVAQRILQSVR